LTFDLGEGAIEGFLTIRCCAIGWCIWLCFFCCHFHSLGRTSGLCHPLGTAQKVRRPTDGPQHLGKSCGRKMEPLWLNRCKGIRTPVRKLAPPTDITGGVSQMNPYSLDHKPEWGGANPLAAIRRQECDPKRPPACHRRL
jgi:hypothetical protein